MAGVGSELGFLFITGRLSRFSKIGGEMVPHLKVEECLQEIMEDATCLVMGVPDPQRGERLVVLHTHPTLTPAAMVEHLNKAELPALWIPKPNQFFAVDSIPTLGTGKTDLRKASELACGKLVPGTSFPQIEASFPQASRP